jgi:hypothetical protein
VAALEQRAQLDPNRLPRGRSYARDGAVGELVLAPGEARAQVQGRKVAPYDVRVRVRRFTDGEWDRVLDAVAAQLGRAAALLDGELPPEVAADVAGAGLDLLPGGGEVGPRCTCPDEADPCKHAAAVCYLLADALDTDPFVLLLLRGRTRDEVLAGLRARRRGDDPARAGGARARGVGTGTEAAGTRSPGGGTARDEGVDARAVLAEPLPSGPIPAPPMPPKRPGHPAALPVGPPPGRAELREDLLALAVDAAARAWEVAVGLGKDAGLGLDPDADLARRAGATLGTPAFSRLAANSGIGGRELARWGLAWRHGGAMGLELLRTEWDPSLPPPAPGRHGDEGRRPDGGTGPVGYPDPQEIAGQAESGDAAGPSEVVDMLKAARVVLREAAGAVATVSRNRVSAGRLQLRLGRDYLWYPYARSDGGWEPAGPPQPDPARAVELL